MSTERQVGFDPFLERDQPQLFEPVDGGLRELLITEVGERVSTPQLERFPKERRCARRLSPLRRLPSLVRETLEASDVEVVLRDCQHISPGPGLECSGRAPEHLPQDET